MAKKKQFHRIHITPMAGTHYKVHHEPKLEDEKGNMPMGMDDEKHEKIFAHSERGDLHKHLDALMDAHEGAGGHAEPDADDMPVPASHPMHKLRRKM